MMGGSDSGCQWWGVAVYCSSGWQLCSDQALPQPTPGGVGRGTAAYGSSGRQLGMVLVKNFQIPFYHMSFYHFFIKGGEWVGQILSRKFYYFFVPFPYWTTDFNIVF